MDTVQVIRRKLRDIYVGRGCENLSVVELIGASFLADEPVIFGPKPDQEYVDAEIAWYMSQSLDVDDLATAWGRAAPPAVWRTVADKDGFINSNYGYLLFSAQNGMQYQNVVRQLKADPESRRGTAVYTRPTIHYDATADGANDFICTNAVNYFIRDDALDAVVQMRSNDVVFGYRNDYAWQHHVLRMMAADLGVPPGDIIWQAASLHVYERHFKFIEAML